MNLVNSLWENPPHTWTEDTRTPIASWNWNGQTYGFYMISIPLWTELLGLLLFETLVVSLLTIPLYYTVVQHPRTWWAHIWTWMAFVPLWLTVPPLLLHSSSTVSLLDCQVKIVAFSLACIVPTTSLFRTTEALFGYTPRYALQSPQAFALYFASPMLLQVDDKNTYVRITTRQLLGHLQDFLVSLLVTGLYQSCFHLFDAFPTLGVQKDESLDQELYSWQRTFQLHTLVDTFWIALLFQLYLTTFGHGLQFATSLVTGFQSQPLMDNPLLSSTSPADFWGRKWNLLVHACLKRGVYRPVRSLGGGALGASLAAFVASGVLHEWILWVVFANHDNNDGQVVWGVTSAFFVWQALLLAWESTSQGRQFWKYVNKAYPHMVPFMVVGMGIPLGHWFVSIYVHSDFFTNAHMLLFKIQQ